MIIRGTTPTHTFENDVDISIVDTLFVTYKQAGRVIFEKTTGDCTIVDGAISTKLTQEETLKLSANHDCQIQIRIKTTEGNAITHEIITEKVGDVLKDEVI